MYSVMIARYKYFPEVKAKGMSAAPRLVLFTSEHVRDQHIHTHKLTHIPAQIKQALRFIGHRLRSLKKSGNNQRPMATLIDLFAFITSTFVYKSFHI